MLLDNPADPLCPRTRNSGGVAGVAKRLEKRPVSSSLKGRQIRRRIGLKRGCLHRSVSLFLARHRMPKARRVVSERISSSLRAFGILFIHKRFVRILFEPLLTHHVPNCEHPQSSLSLPAWAVRRASALRRRLETRSSPSLPSKNHRRTPLFKPLVRQDCLQLERSKIK